MTDGRIALITGANQGIGLQVATELAAHGATVLVGSRDPARGEAAAAAIGKGASAIRIDLTDRASIDAAAERIRAEWGRLDLLVNNAAISHSGKTLTMPIPEYVQRTRPSVVSLDEVRTVWETNVFGTLAVTQAMLPLLRHSADARIVMVSSSVGSLASNADPAYPWRSIFGPTYSASKTALNAITLALMIELEGSGIKINLVSPGYTKTNLNGYSGTEPVDEGSREVVRVALLGPDGPTGTYTGWENQTIPW